MVDHGSWPEDVARPYFFLSYAHSPRVPGAARERRTHWEERLFQDLCEAVAELAGLDENEPVGFMDAGEHEDENWSERITEALAHCRVFVPLYSPRYFRSEACGQEWAAFTSRQVLFNRPGLHAGQINGVVPVQWVPFEEGDLPDVARPLQYAHRSFGEDYETDGLLSLSRLSYFRPQYELAVLRLAQTIVRVAQQTTITVGRRRDFQSRPSAFRPPDQRRQLRIAVMACDVHNLPPGRSADTYGISAVDWQPYRDTTGSLARRAAYVARQAEFHPSIHEFEEEAHRLLRGDAPASPGLLLLDRWSLLDRDRRELLRRFDAENPTWVGVLEPWPGDDPESERRNDELTRLADDTLRHMRAARRRLYGLRANDALAMLEDFEHALPAAAMAAQHAFDRLRRRTEPDPRAPDRPTLRYVAPTSREHDKAPLPDREPLAGGAAPQPTESSGWGSNGPGGGEIPASAGPSDAGAWRPPQPASAPAGPVVPGSSASGADEEQPRVLTARAPSATTVDSEFSVIVRIGDSMPREDEATVAAPMLLRVPESGTKVTVVASPASAGLVPLEGLERTFLVRPGPGHPDPERFLFRACAEGLQRIQFSAWAGGSFLCELEIEVSVHASGREAVWRTVSTPVGPVRAVQGEVTLLINRLDGRLAFQFISERYLGSIVHAQSLVRDLDAPLEEVVATLGRLAAGRARYESASARRLMRETGVGLWRQLVPEVIKDEFWNLRSQISTFTIATDDDIPWELLYPLAPGCDLGFLVEGFPVVRRTRGQGRTRSLHLGSPRFVVSSAPPRTAEAEFASLQGILGSGPVIDRLQDLLEALDAGDLGVAHFACHNTFTPGIGSCIDMQGGPLVPELLNSVAVQRSLARMSPVVFVNACRSMGADLCRTLVTGWAQQFLTAGAGAFIGTLWNVRSDKAASFATTFYTALAAGTPFGQAVFAARKQAAAEDDDPTWLAYCAYGDPAATI
ncbi:hypothetical protein DN069_24015 [Streptacidiphilus pinicola]|uniref:CHAT domain-containing protein n=1 Tax=Streptacidiphilus pinicola TaxID=2219663 RepID=A0A2X0IYY4_9ACTN|nr:TIR-like protein FxsC [Streptacidiphilus pinicola]RAG83106.1 hypothetical protein DN069_24015 [Streptacidiphilus pinicola]